MAVVTVTRPVAAPADHVFRAISDLEHLPQTVPHIVGVEFLTERRAGPGTRFRETRKMGGQTHVTVLEVVDYDPAARTLRMVAETPGTTWDTAMEVRPDGATSQLTFRMTARGHSWSRSLLHQVMRSLYRRGLATHADAVRTHCERSA